MNTYELSIDLTAQDLLAPFNPPDAIEVDDICAVDPLLQAPHAANDPCAPAPEAEDTVEIELTSREIELTSEQLDEFLQAT